MRCVDFAGTAGRKNDACFIQAEHAQSFYFLKQRFLVWVIIFMSLSVFAAPRDAEWKKVDDAMKQGLPQTAVTNLEPIIQGALKDKAYAEATKAIGLRIILLGNVQG